MIEVTDLPKSVNLRKLHQADGQTYLMPPVYSQGNLGSCVANVGAAIVQFMMAKHGITNFYPSRLFLYYYARLLGSGESGVKDPDGSCNIVDIPAALETYGICPENLWPYSDDTIDPALRVTQEPSQEARKEALENRMKLIYGTVGVRNPSDPQADRVGTDQPLDSLQHLKWVLAQDIPVAFGFNFCPSFDNVFNVIGADGKLSFLEPKALKVNSSTPSIIPEGVALEDDNQPEGHAVVAVGYDDTASPPNVIIRNSWGAHWGDGGMPTCHRHS